jgi:ribosomal-protein-alanine N-acetyltransferase
VTTAEDSTSVRVRRAERADLLAVMGIERASFSQPWPYDAFQRFVGDAGFLVAVDDATDAPSDDSVVDPPVVGYVVADVVPNHGRPIGHIKDIAVDPDRRGEGVGSTLVESALHVVDASAVKLEVRESNETARRLYRRFGFEPSRRVPRYYDGGEDAIVMVRRSTGR